MSQIESKSSPVLAGASDAVLERLEGIWDFRFKKGHRGARYFVRYHILHLMLAGTYTLTINGQELSAGPDDLVVYRPGDVVEWVENREAVRFVSVAFTAQGIALKDEVEHLRASTKSEREAFLQLLALAEKPEAKPTHQVRLQGRLLELLAVVGDQQWRELGKPKGHRWLEIEPEIRRNRWYDLHLNELADLAGCSRATLVRACREATGESPHQRLRQLRIGEAAGLLRASTLAVGEIARHLRYSRSHEFSRDFRAFIGVSPSAYRQGNDG